MAAVTTSEAPKLGPEASLLKSIAKFTEMEHMALQETKKLSIIEAVDRDYIQGVSQPPYSDSALANPFDETLAREWVKDVVMKFARGPPAYCRRRPLAEVAIKDVSIMYGNEDTFRVRVYVPAAEGENNAPRPALVMYHGGGWIHGYPEVDEDLSIFFASELRAIIVNVDYRLAPEYKFPLPLNDCYQAVQWTLDHAQEYNIDTTRVAIWGCSAGGNLAAGVALRDAEEHEKSRICHVNLVVPATSHPELYTEALKSDDSSVNKFDAGLGREAINILLDKYAGDKSRDRFVSVLQSDIPSNHPPVHVTVAGRDFLRDEGIAYSLKIRDAGIDSELDIVPGVPHGMLFPPTTHVARQFFKNQVRVLDYALNYL